MPKITFIEHNGTRHEIEVSEGTSLMQAAVANMVPGIEGDCGGLCACGTCHVYIRPDFQPACGEAEDLEQAILDFAYDVNDRSRLGCQIDVTAEMDGMEIDLPERQY